MKVDSSIEFCSNLISRLKHAIIAFSILRGKVYLGSQKNLNLVSLGLYLAVLIMIPVIAQMLNSINLFLLKMLWNAVAYSLEIDLLKYQRQFLHPNFRKHG